MTDAYTLWKTAHVISAAILFGTGLGIAFFAWFGYRQALAGGGIEVLRTVLRLTVLGDLCFTTPAVIFQVVSGLVLMHLDHWPLFSPWSLTVFGLYVFVGLCWLPVVVIQIAMSREAERVSEIGALSGTFHRRFRVWFILGVPAFIAVVGLFYLMISKAVPLGSG